MRRRITAAGRVLAEVALTPGNAAMLGVIVLCMYLVAAHGEAWPALVFAAAGALDVAADQHHARRDSGESETEQEVTS